MISRSDIEKILDRNIKEIPWEGTEINKTSIIEELMGLINPPKESEWCTCDKPQHDGDYMDAHCTLCKGKME